MSSQLLIAYTTKNGSTKEVAEAIAQTLGGEGLESKVLNLRQVDSLAGYRAIVIGAPFYYGAWSKDALAFIEKHRRELESLPVALFALGPSSEKGEELRKACEHFRQVLVNSVTLKPFAAEVFGGRFDPTKLGLAEKLVACLPACPLHGLPASDARDWKAIEAWAKAVAEGLR